MHTETYNQSFLKIDYRTESIARQYESCTFNNCNFEGQDLSNVIFIDCIFDHCNLSNCALQRTAFRNVQFSNCKLLGLRFDHCEAFLFEIAASDCMINLASFYKMKLAKTKFKNCAMKEVDFMEADLTAAIFDNCDLLAANFDRAILKKADLRSAYNFSIDPEQTSISQARFNAMNVLGLLYKYNIKVE